MQRPKRTLESSHDELDMKLELLQQLCLQDAADLQAPDNPHHRNRTSYLDERWIQAEYGWAMESAATSTVSFLDEAFTPSSPPIASPTTLAGELELELAASVASEDFNLRVFPSLPSSVPERTSSPAPANDDVLLYLYIYIYLYLYVHVDLNDLISRVLRV
ncbi:hypothetical protein EVJ58_g171 [Rhodofomes roseus]|uniref:Uncharacterized protein n=1 Tax=Rhodofomes roseus TaxID=34475 RepID=A0A4Y9Z5V7_9APHY|nr:hypothetical protein EVJ58_g171 [Rhodofomes roseus]